MPTRDATNSRIAILDAQRFSIKAGADATYDQICKVGEFVKEGESVTFSAETLASMVRNFAKQANPLPADVEHQLCYVPMNGQPAPLAARYDSLALVLDGKVTAYHSQSGAPTPDVSGWADGLFARRSEMTNFGRDLLENKGYGFISPTFQIDGVDAQGKEQGYTLLSASWVNLPFLDGMQPVTFTKFGGAFAGSSPTPGAHAMAIDAGVASEIRAAFEAGRHDDAAALGIKHASDLGLDGNALYRMPATEAAGKVLAALRARSLSASPAAATTMGGIRKADVRVGVGVTAGNKEGTVTEVRDDGVMVKWNGATSPVFVEYPDLGGVKMSATPAAATTMANPTKAEWEAGLRGDEESLRRMEQNLATIRAGGKVENLTAENAARAIDGLKQAIANKRALISSMSAAPTQAGKGATTMALASATDRAGRQIRVGSPVSIKSDHGSGTGTVTEIDQWTDSVGPLVKVSGAGAINGGWYQVKTEVTAMSTSAPPRRFNQGATAMNPEKMAARFGFEPNDDAETKLAKCMAGLADEEVKAMGDLEIVHKEEDEPEEVAAMAADLGVEPGPKVMSRMRAALAATRAPVTAMAALQGEVKALSAKLAARDEADATARINTFADDAIKEGRWDAGKRAELVTFARADIKAATASLLPEGTYNALARITAGLDSRGNAGGAMPDANGVQRFGVSLSAAAKKMSAEKGISFESALMECGKNPELARDYLAR